ncbi:MAG: sugar transferase [Desulfovibrio sp.]|nr:sugar transferase [Desulfovibrio sp.]
MSFSAAAPVALFAYARPDHLQATLEALAANELAGQTSLTIFSDGPRADQDAPAVQAVRALARQEQQAGRFARVDVVERDRNWGLADSIVDGVTTLCAQHGRVIVLEDDIVTSCCFLRYMNDALTRYAEAPQVMHIAGHNFDIDPQGLPESFFMGHTSCWGWATWQRAWVHFSRDAEAFVREFDAKAIHRFNLDGAYDYWSQLLANRDGTLKTWAVFWYASVFRRGGLCLHPRASLVENIGHDGSGANCGVMEALRCKACLEGVSAFPTHLQVHAQATARVQDWLRRLAVSPVAQKHVVARWLAGIRQRLAPRRGAL